MGSEMCIRDRMGTGHDEYLDQHRSGTGPRSSQHPSFAGSYIVNGRAASPAEAQHLVANGVQPGAWVAAERAAFTASASTSGQKCYYVLDVLLCDWIGRWTEDAC